MLFFCTENKILTKMGKSACKKKDYKTPENPKYYCKKCGAIAKKEGKVCKPKKIKLTKNQEIL